MLMVLWSACFTRTGYDFYKQRTDEGFDYQFAFGKLYGGHQFLNWWQRYATGISHLDGFESQSDGKKKNHTQWCGFSFWQRMRDSNLLDSVH